MSRRPASSLRPNLAVIDETHDPALPCWVPDAAGHPDFPIQNLPLGIFSPPGGTPRGGVAIGGYILDLAACQTAGLLDGLAEAALGPILDPLLTQGAAARQALRSAVSLLLSGPPRPTLLHRATECLVHLPTTVGDYTDFYAGIHHATNVGRLLRADVPLTPNYKWMPIGYHGRASSVRPSGAPLRRPNGQRKRAADAEPSFGPSRNLDYELELGIWIGTGHATDAPMPIGEAASHVAGFCLLNDWSARDLQGWEYQPLGPFLGKSFCTTISPWIVTPEALAPFRAAQPTRPADDPRPLPYLWDEADQAGGALGLTLEVWIRTAAMRAAGMPPYRLARSSALDLYWTPAQLVAHHASNGCNLRSGDLLGSGTISGATRGSEGSLLELTRGGREPLALAGGELRRFLEDGDEVTLTGHAVRDGFATIGFGPCVGTVLPAV
jgi:fumarylacetoacetase